MCCDAWCVCRDIVILELGVQLTESISKLSPPFLPFLVSSSLLLSMRVHLLVFFPWKSIASTTLEVCLHGFFFKKAGSSCRVASHHHLSFWHFASVVLCWRCKGLLPQPEFPQSRSLHEQVKILQTHGRTVQHLQPRSEVLFLPRTYASEGTRRYDL